MYFVRITYRDRRAMSCYEFDSFEKAVAFSAPKVETYNISICSDEGIENGELDRREIIAFKAVI